MNKTNPFGAYFPVGKMLYTTQKTKIFGIFLKIIPCLGCFDEKKNYVLPISKNMCLTKKLMGKIEFKIIKMGKFEQQENRRIMHRNTYSRV